MGERSPDSDRLSEIDGRSISTRLGLGSKPQVLRNEKTESKVAVLTGGLSKRALTVQTEILQMHAELQNAAIEAAVYQNLKEHEERGGARRIDALRRKINSLANDSVLLDATLTELVEKKQATMPQSESN